MSSAAAYWQIRHHHSNSVRWQRSESGFQAEIHERRGEKSCYLGSKEKNSQSWEGIKAESESHSDERCQQEASVDKQQHKIRHGIRFR